MIRETTWENPGHEWGSEVAMCGPLALAGRWLPTELPPTSDELWWDIHDIRDVVKFVAGLFDVPCKLHYYFKNYAGTVDCYVHYKEQMSRKWCFEHYSVLDIWDPTYYNVAKDYRYRGRVDNPEWLFPAPRAML